jgi:hypothetical protein
VIDREQAVIAAAKGKKMGSSRNRVGNFGRF